MKRVVLIFALCWVSLIGFSQDNVWINPDGGTWSVGANWSLGHMPTASENAIINGDSFSADNKIITASTGSCLNFDISGCDQFITIQGNQVLTVYGSFYGSSNVLLSGRNFTFAATTAQTITFNSLRGLSGAWTFNGVNGSWAFQDDYVNATIAITLYNGSIDTNGKTFATTGQFSTATGTKSLIVGSNTITFGGWNNSATANFTFTPNASTIILTSQSGGNLYGVTTFWNLTLQSMTSPNCVYVVGNNMIVTNLLSFIGTNEGVARLYVVSSTALSQRTFTADSVYCINTDFTDIKGAGDGNWDFSTISAGDALGNSDIIFKPGVTLYYYSNTGNYSDASKWYLGTGGSGGAGRIPLAQDSVVFDANSFSSSSTLTVDMSRLGKAVDMSGVDQPVNFTVESGISGNQTGALYVYGNFYWCDNITTDMKATVFYQMGRNQTMILDPHGKNFHSYYASGFRGANMSDTLKMTTGCYCSGYFNSKNQIVFQDVDVTSVSMNFSCATGGTYVLGSGTLKVYGTSSTVFTLGTLTNEGTGKLVVAPASGSSNVIVNISYVYDNTILNNLELGGGAGTGFIQVALGPTTATPIYSGGEQYIDTIRIIPGTKVKFYEGANIHVNDFIAPGTAGAGITLGTVTNNNHILWKETPSHVYTSYMTISYSDARGYFNLKSANQVAYLNINKINGVVIASIMTFNQVGEYFKWFATQSTGTNYLGWIITP